MSQITGTFRYDEHTEQLWLEFDGERKDLEQVVLRIKPSTDKAQHKSMRPTIKRQWLVFDNSQQGELTGAYEL